MQLLVDDERAQRRHPLLVVAPIQEAAPLADEQRSDVVFVDVEPVGTPHVLGQGLPVPLAFEPGLLEHAGTVVVRRVDQLVLVGAQVDGVVGDAAQVAAPPGGVVVPPIGRGPVLPILGVDLDPLAQDEHVRVDREDALTGGLADVLEVVDVRGAVPLGARGLVGFAVGLVLDVCGDDGVVVLVPLGDPLPGRVEVLGGDIALVPDRVVVPGVVGLRAVHVKHDFEAVLFAQLQPVVEHFEGVHPRQFGVDVLVDSTRSGLAVLPLQQQLGADGDTHDVDAALGHRTGDVLDVGGPQPVEHPFAGVEAEPVGSGEPHLVARGVHDPVAVRVQPVSGA